MKKATRAQTKQHNTKLILKTIYEQGDVSRADIARHTRLTRPTVSSLVAELIERQFVEEIGHGPSAGGKPPTLLNITQDAYYIVCLDLGGADILRGALVNLQGEIIVRHEIPRPQTAVLSQVHKLINLLLEGNETQLLGIGIGSPGLIDPIKGIVRNAVNLGWQDLPIKEMLQQAYQVPVYVANDSHISALAEYTFGETAANHNLIVIKVRQGVGAGILFNSEIFYGDGFGAGEIGHVRVVANDKVCTCGNVGCLETVASTRAILAHAREALNLKDVTLASLTDLVNQQNKTAQAIVAQAGDHLGHAIAYLVGCFNIRQVIVSGAISVFGDSFLQIVHEAMSQSVLSTMASETEISYSQLGNDIVLLGCAAMVLQQELGIV